MYNGMGRDDAVMDAVEYCIENHMLEDILIKIIAAIPLALAMGM